MKVVPLAIVVLIIFVLIGRMSWANPQQGQETLSTIAEAKALIREAEATYQRLPVGPTSQYLYLVYKERFTLNAPDFETFCATLVASSLNRYHLQDDIRKEYERIYTYVDGLLLAYGEVGMKWGLTGRFSIAKVDTLIKDKHDLELFKTALLADNIASVWAFAVGFHSYKIYGEALEIPRGVKKSPSQAEVNKILKEIGAEEIQANAVLQ